MEESSIKNPLQIKFFDRLKKSVSKNISLANEIADVLEISQDGAYRRLRGESVLSMDELVKLCRHYKISPDVIANPDDSSANFYFKNLINNETGFEEYVNNILSDLKKINGANPKQIIYAAGDIPIFHQFQFPDFAAFKIFFWQKAMLNLPSCESKKFTFNNINPKLSELCKNIAEEYIQIPSIEIWHEDTVVSNLKIIEYAWEAGFFTSNEDALLICKQITDMLLSIEKQVEKSSKFITEEKWAVNEGNFTMYQSEFQLTNNHIFVTTGNTKTLYLTHNTFNSMATTNSIFYNETEEWLKNIMRKSLIISGVAEKQRHTFFKKARDKVTELISKISLL